MGKNEVTKKGVVIEALGNIQYKIETDETKQEVRAYMSGKMKLNRIKVLIGDRVEYVVDQYGPNNRIIRRLDKEKL